MMSSESTIRGRHRSTHRGWSQREPWTAVSTARWLVESHRWENQASGITQYYLLPARFFPEENFQFFFNLSFNYAEPPKVIYYIKIYKVIYYIQIYVLMKIYNVLQVYSRLYTRFIALLAFLLVWSPRCSPKSFSFHVIRTHMALCVCNMSDP